MTDELQRIAVLEIEVAHLKTNFEKVDSKLDEFGRAQQNGFVDVQAHLLAIDSVLKIYSNRGSWVGRFLIPIIPAIITGVVIGLIMLLIKGGS